MPPARTGTVDRNRRADGSAYYRARIRLADGARIRVDVPARSTATPRSGPRALRGGRPGAGGRDRGTAGGRSENAKRNEAMQCDESAENTCDAYFKRFLEHRSSMGRVRRARDLESAWTVWISPRIGSKPMAGDNRVNRGDVEDVRDALDMAVAQRKRERSGRAGLSGARARNVWSVLTSMMKEACTSKRQRPARPRRQPLQHRAASRENGSAREDVRLPERVSQARELRGGAPRLARALRGRLLPVPASWGTPVSALDGRGLRGGCGTRDEGVRRGLEDGEGPQDAQRRARRSDSVSPPAPPERDARSLRIQERLGPTAPAGAEREPSRRMQMRQHLKLARVERARLSEESSTTMQINFRSWRDTGITWLALQGLDVAKIQRRAGHDSVSTTLGYVKMAEDLTGSIGQPFPPLPEALVGKGMGAGRTPSNVPKLNGSKPPSGKADQAQDWAKRSVKNSTRMNLHVNTVGEAGFEPATTSTQSSCTTGLCDSPEDDGSLASRSAGAYGAGGGAPAATKAAPEAPPVPAAVPSGSP